MKGMLVAWAMAAATMGCGGSTLPALSPEPATQSNGCRDWVHDAAGGVRWKLNDEEDGITTFIGEVPESDFYAFRGVGVIDAPIARVANVLIDTTRYGEWVPHFGGMRIVRDISETEKIVYRHVTTPVIDDRDFVVRVNIHKEEETGHLLFDVVSVQDPDAPVNDDKVRGEIHEHSGYRMWPIDGGKRTMLIFTIHVDPRGSVPAWIVNLFQDAFPLDNLRNIRAQVAKADVEPHPKVAEAFSEYRPPCGTVAKAPTAAAPR